MTINYLSNLIEILQYRSKYQPDKKAYIFLQDSDRELGFLTYQQLDEQARAIAAQLQNLNLKGERVLLLYPQGLEVIAAFYGCLYAGVIAIPAPFPDFIRYQRTVSRLEVIIKDAGASLILTTSNIKTRIKEIQELSLEMPEFQRQDCLSTDEISLEIASDWKQPKIDPSDLAYLQYTSGSTSHPKGVMISHGNLIHNCASMTNSYKYTSESISVIWLPYYHDYGLIMGIAEPLYVGIPSLLMSPVNFIKYPIRWLQIISNYRATITAGPNFAYEYCIHKISPEAMKNLDLSCWQLASVGAEPIRFKTIQQFVNKYQECGFSASAFEPAYGLAESTLVVSYHHKVNDHPIFCSLVASELEKNIVLETSLDVSDAPKFANCGQAISDTKIIIVHPENLTQCTPNEIGEIWVSGPSVGLGYWNHPEETGKKFQAYLTDTGEGPFLRTGDLGFLKDGDLFVTGRLKDLIIIAGKNYYPHDIELTVEQSHPSLRPTCCAAFSLDRDGQERLVILAEIERRYQKDRRQQIVLPEILEKRRGERRQEYCDESYKREIGEPLNYDTVLKNIRMNISMCHELQVYAIVLIKTGTIAKTSSGKIQRSGCLEAFVKNKLDVISMWSENSFLQQ